jgi:predicted RNA-binding Zn-ribbon protein involved in translation (DUF1610 family)
MGEELRDKIRRETREKTIEKAKYFKSEITKMEKAVRKARRCAAEISEDPFFTDEGRELLQSVFNSLYEATDKIEKAGFETYKMGAWNLVCSSCDGKLLIDGRNEVPCDDCGATMVHTGVGWRLKGKEYSAICLDCGVVNPINTEMKNFKCKKCSAEHRWEENFGWRLK